MDLTNETKSKLVVARSAMEALNDTAKKNADGGGLSEEVAVLERDVAGASTKFLSATKPEKLTAAVGKKKAKRAKRSQDPKLEDGWVTLRFRITPDQREVIAAAMERARELSDIQDRKQWKGVALEYVAADFIASHGMPAQIPDADNPKGP